MSNLPEIPDYTDHAKLGILACGSMMLGLVARSFPAFRLWLGVVPIVVVSVGLILWGLSNHWEGWRAFNASRIGRVRAHSGDYWDFWRIAQVLMPVGVFWLAVILGALAG